MKTKFITLLFIILTKSSFGQYQQYLTYVTPYLSAPITPNGFFYFNTPNNFLAGSLYQIYRLNAPDLDNNMLLVDTHVDQLAGFTHYKYQQTYKGIPIEGAGCIEHYDSKGSLSFINAKVADSIHSDGKPRISEEQAIKSLIDDLIRDKEILFAWEDPAWEQQIRTDHQDSSATWYPTADLIFAIDQVNDMQVIIPGSRFTLAYKISITTLLPENETNLYYVDAITGTILKVRSTHIDVTGDVYGYGNRNLDTDWQGGFVHKYRLLAMDNGHDIHTKKWDGTNTWSNMNEVNLNANNWGNTYLTETSTHYHVTNSWDYFYNTFGRQGMDGSGTGIRVKTQYDGPNSLNAYYSGDISPNELTFGHTSSAWDLGMEPSIVGHEFTHGITKHTAGLFFEFESGALNESFSDIFGTVIQAQTLDWGATDWIIGNHIPSMPIDVTRSFINPSSRGNHWTGNYDALGNPIYALGQPASLGDINWCDVCPFVVDKGGVHINSGVQNRWFQILTTGSTAQNVVGIGMTDAARISYLALTSILLNSSEYADSRDATIEAARIIFGECSQQHRSTADAWTAVNILSGTNCIGLSLNEINTSQILIYPNPTSSIIQISLPQVSSSPIKIFDLNGKVVHEFENSELNLQTDVSHLDAGVYLMEFTFGEQQLVKRIIVQK